MSLHQFSLIFPSILAPQPQKCLFFRHYFVTQYFQGKKREREENIILQLPLQDSKCMQGERLSNDGSTAAACASHPLFSLHSACSFDFQKNTI